MVNMKVHPAAPPCCLLTPHTSPPQLLAVLDSLPDVDVSGLKVTVGEAYGVDALGTIRLHAGDSLQAWARCATKC